MPRASRIITEIAEIVVGLIAIVIILSGLLIWRLSMAPITSSYFTPYVEQAIESLIPGTQAKVGSSELIWDNADHLFALHLEQVRLTGGNGASIATVPDLDMRISLAGLLLGRLIPAGLLIDHPQVQLTRAADGQFLFAGMPPSAGGGDLKSTVANMADDLAHAFFIRKLEISRASFAIHDEKNNSDWAIGIPEIVLERSGFNLSGRAMVEVIRQGKAELLAVHYEYDRSNRDHDLIARFSGLNPSFLAASPGVLLNLPLTGQVSVALDEHLNIAAAALDVAGAAGTLDDPALWDQPCPVKSLKLKAEYDGLKGTLNVPQATLDFGGPTLSLTLTGTPVKAGMPAHDLAFNLSVKLDKLPMDKSAAIWPKPAIPGARAWIAASLSKGTFDRGAATFKGTLDWDNLAATTVTEGSGTITASGGTVLYLPDMPPVENAAATAHFDLDRMTIQVTGALGALKLLPSTIAITDFQQHVQNIVLPLHIAGPAPAILTLLDAPRFGYTKALGLKPHDIEGAVDGTVTLSFPLLKSLKMADVDVRADAKLADLSSSKLVPGHTLTHGNLALALDKNGFSLKGPVAIDNVPVTADYGQSFVAGKDLRQASVSADLDGPQWAQLGIAPLADTKGPIVVALHMEQKSATAPLAVTGTLDMRKAAMQVAELDWEKPADTPATLTFAAEAPAKGGIRISSISVKGPGLSIKGKATLAAGTHDVLNLDLDPFVIGRTDARLRFSQVMGAKGSMQMEAGGKSLDIGGLRGGHDIARADPRPKEYRIKVARLYTSAFGFIADAHGYAIRDKEGWNAISLKGMADGNHPLSIELTPQSDGARTFSATCDDFGKALKGLGFTDTVRGGKVAITGSSTLAHPRIVEGKVKIGAFDVKGLPALVNLMNATSPFGLFDLLTGTISFDSLDGKFSWQDDTLGLKQVRAIGSSVGMNVDGTVDMNSGKADLYGTIAPFSFFNRIIGAIPVLGDLLTGGENQGVLAANYTIRGTLDKPDVGVNPVSILTPGFLRNLFFGGDQGSPSDTAPPAPTLAPAQTNINKSE